MSGNTKRLIGVTVCALVVCVLIGFYVGIYLTTSPGSASAAAVSTPPTAHLYIGTVAASEASDPHPTWVSYYAVDASSHNWRHATTYVVPAHSVIQVTIYQYDGQSGLRNPFIAQATGTIGGGFLLDGKPTKTIDPDTASHIFAIPQFGVSVPLMGISDDEDTKNGCDQAPCTLDKAHHTITFSFRTPGPGLYRWQCFVPCAAGFINGFGGPMQTVGYMDGYIKVV